MNLPLPEFVITRSFKAPLEKVFKAWSDAENFKRWWGPVGFKTEVKKFEFRVGGVFHYYLLSPAGQDMWAKFTYREITPPSKIVFLNGFSDAAGGVGRHPMAPTWPAFMLTTVTFEEKNGETVITLKAVPHEANEIETATFVAGMPSMNVGFGGTFDQLAAYLAG
jgi:uncharacterized protein YndB with AHSA1/START domain